MRWSGRLDAFEGPASAAAAAWLQEPGLLTERLRACCSGRSGLTVVAEYDATISVAALGARLAAIPGIVRGPLEFTLLCAPSALWARRSWYEMDGDRLMVQEVFLPEALA